MNYLQKYSLKLLSTVARANKRDRDVVDLRTEVAGRVSRDRRTHTPK